MMIKLKMSPLLKASILAFSFVLLSSCISTQENQEAPLSTPRLQEGISTSYLPTSIISTPLSTLANTSMPTINPIMTFMPTLPATEAEAKVMDLLHNNGGCRLPCFWNFTPGQSSEQTFVSTRYALGGSEITFPRDDLWVEISAIEGNGAQSGILRRIETSMIIYRKLENMNQEVFGNPAYAEYFSYYSLPNLLSTYGKPQNVFIFLDAGIADMGLGIDLFMVFLDYSKSGWVARLTMPLLWKGDSKPMAVGCPHEGSTQLQLWSPGDTAMERQYGFAGSAHNLYSIEKTSIQTLDEFYQLFRVPSNIECIEVPLE
jgi:hypothetical protein